MGIWRFLPSVTEDELREVAKLWAQQERYTSVCVRKASKEQFGIGFTVAVPVEEDLEKAHKAYWAETADYLKRRFGNGLASWDIASGPDIIK